MATDNQMISPNSKLISTAHRIYRVTVPQTTSRGAVCTVMHRSIQRNASDNLTTVLFLSYTIPTLFLHYSYTIPIPSYAMPCYAELCYARSSPNVR